MSLAEAKDLGIDNPAFVIEKLRGDGHLIERYGKEKWRLMDEVIFYVE